MQKDTVTLCVFENNSCFSCLCISLLSGRGKLSGRKEEEWLGANREANTFGGKTVPCIVWKEDSFTIHLCSTAEAMFS